MEVSRCCNGSLRLQRDGGAKTAATGVDARKGRERLIRWLGLSTPSIRTRPCDRPGQTGQGSAESRIERFPVGDVGSCRAGVAIEESVLA